MLGLTKAYKNSITVSGAFNRRRGSLRKTLTDEEENVDFSCVGRTTTKARTIHRKPQQKEEEEACFVNHSHHHRYDADTSSPVSLVSLLKECTKKKDLHRGSQIHSAIARRHLLQENIFLASTLVNMYAK
eukprot:c3327_g1_i1 orf=2-388(-)